jgi:hypothetical protein
MTSDDMVDLVKAEVKSLSSKLAEDDYTNAIEDAKRETGFGLPTDDPFRILWLKNRAKRHLFFYLMSESAHKFKYDTINLNQRFEHYMSLITMMDQQFEKVMEDNPELFGDEVLAAYLYGGMKVDAGFIYDYLGRDVTYKAR